jgi:hypothetical protein
MPPSGDVKRSIRFPVGACSVILEPSGPEVGARSASRPFQNGPQTADGKPDGMPGRGSSRVGPPRTIPKSFSNCEREAGWNASPGRAAAAERSSVPRGFPSVAGRVSWIRHPHGQAGNSHQPHDGGLRPGKRPQRGELAERSPLLQRPAGARRLLDLIGGALQSGKTSGACRDRTRGTSATPGPLRDAAGRPEEKSQQRQQNERNDPRCHVESRSSSE